MKSKWVVVISVIALVLAGGWIYRNQHGATAPAGTSAPAGAAASRATLVEAAVVGRRDLADEVTAVGTLRSAESVMLRPELAGRIARIAFDEGRPVHKGAVLVQLDDAVQQAEHARARAALGLAQANYKRTQDLFGRKYVSRSALDEAAANLRVAEAEARVTEARLHRMAVRAPFDGIVGIRNVSVGDYVKEGEDLVNLEDIETLKVDFRIPERYLAELRLGQTVTLTADALAERAFESRVIAIDPLVEAQDRAVLLRAELDNRGHALRPGMFARVRLRLAERPDVLVIPEQAVMSTPEGTQVFRVRDGVARSTPVRLGARRGTWVEVAEGLAEGDTVVTAGQIKIRDGAAVTVAAPDVAAN
ncbi:efflux RND transporter periplasmic adaptor subunit [Nitrogeniibacter mangrovi]|uniref:Efflux RND transporter periplasmic adaptor subunit n=1 Tax=Nitrogeniibacter mangrovi TaxID=2016596 RepID=A0A6C1B6U3_9RHOO|nr:efflux RND transporter periplasmic adaptor subunit [Nitrogeniibacter mangrovi]QID18448.1 efflux RND transporter periplasmic adaptor subunit [Nitrogeniibacter mangrovi]